MPGPGGSAATAGNGAAATKRATGGNGNGAAATVTNGASARDGGGAGVVSGVGNGCDGSAGAAEDDGTRVNNGGGAAEDNGYLVGMVYDADVDRSSLVILDAADFSRGPLARVWLTHMVPHGLHGAFTETYYGPPPPKEE